MENGKKIYMIPFLVLLLLTFLLVVISEIDYVKQYFSTPNQTVWSAKSEYPFDENASVNSTGLQISSAELQISEEKNTINLSHKIDTFKTIIKTAATDSFTLQLPFASLTKYIDRYCWGYSVTTSVNKTETAENSDDDIVIKDSIGNLYIVVGPDSIDDNFNKLTEFYDSMKMEGRDFLFLEVPVNAYGEDRLTEYPNYYRDYSKQLTDELLSKLRASGIPHVSMSMEYYGRNMKASDIYRKTDHHWTPEAALLACRCLAENLNKNFGYQVDYSVFDIKNYDVIYDENPTFGSLGAKATKAYIEPEILQLIIPCYDTNLSVFVSSLGINKTGTIQEVLFNYSVLEDDDYYSDHWSFYSYGCPSLVQIHNNDIHDGRRILILRNSFADLMIPYLGNLAEDVDVLMVNMFDGSLQTFINETDPDAVIVAYTIRTFQKDDEYFVFN